MIRTYFNIAMKYLVRQPSYSLMSIVGLTLALASAFLIYSHAVYQLSYDKHVETWDRVYRLSGKISLPDNENIHAILGPRIGKAMKDEIPAVEEACRLRPAPSDYIFSAGENSYYEDQVYNADPSVFRVFPIQFLYGTARDALTGEGKAVISQRIAQRYFGKEDVVGEYFKLNNEKEFIVTAVIENLPPNTHHRLDILLSMQSLDPQLFELLNAEYSENYWRPSCFHFILLGQKNSIEDIENSFPAFFERHMAEFGERLKADFELILTPLPDVHFTSQYSYDYPKGNRSYIYLFIVAGLFIFLIAILNYSSLFSSSLATRTRSLGIYKVNGAIGKQVYGLLIMESFIMMIISSLIALFLLSAFRPWTSLLLEQAVFQNMFSSGGVIWLLLTISIIVGTAFLIPVFLRVRKQPARLLKGESQVTGKKFTLLGKGSVIFQFTLSVILIISSMLISAQVQHMLSADPGYDTENVVQVKLNAPRAPVDRIASFKEELTKSPLISRTAFSTNIPGEQFGTVYFDLEKGGTQESRIISLLGVDADYIPLMRMKFREGRNFNPGRKTDPQRAVILNEAGVNFLGLGDSIAGTKIGDIIINGVLKNGQYNSLHEGSKPIAFYPDLSNKGYMNIRLNTENLSSALIYIREVYDQFFEDIPFEATFLDDSVKEMYREDITQSRLLIIFTLISIILANMGLFGLVSLMARKKTKEIGIRKVNGAYNWQVLLLLNRQLLLWLLISVVAAIPISLYFIGLWLQNFASKINFSWWVIPAAGLIVLFVALLTTSWITWRAANQNPVETLRYE